VRLADRRRLAGQQRLVELEIALREHGGIGRHAVAFGQHDDVAAHHLAPGDAPLLAAAHHQRPRARQIAQGFQHTLGALLLVDGDAEHHQHEARQHGGLAHVAQHEVNGARRHQQQEHRLAQHLERDDQRGAMTRTGQLVVALGGEARRRLGRRQALDVVPVGLVGTYQLSLLPVRGAYG
jgi:hypothetical protein